MIPHNKPFIDQDDIDQSSRVLSSGMVAHGIETEKFEEEFVDFLGGGDKTRCVFVPSGSVALYLCLRELKVENRKVFLPSYTCRSLEQSILMNHGHPDFIDVAKGGVNISTNDIVNRDPVGIVPHMFGDVVDLSGINRDEIVEDCSQSLGAKINCKQVGSNSRFSVFSFYATKLMTGGGQGGAVVTNDLDVYESINDFKKYDQRKNSKMAFNLNSSDICAAIARSQLKKLNYFIRRREDIFQYYLSREIPLLDFSRANKEVVRFRALLRFQRIDVARKFIEHMMIRQVRCIIPIEKYELLGDKNLFPNSLSNTETLVSIPIFPKLSDEEVAHIADSVLSFKDFHDS